MSQSTIPDAPPNGTTNKDVKSALKVIQNNFSDQQKHSQDITHIQDLIKSSYEVVAPKGLSKIASGLLVQLAENIAGRLQIPSATYYVQTDVPEAAPHIGKLLQDGVETIMERGGLEACFTEKPAGFYQASYYGDFMVRIGTDTSSDLPIKYDIVNIDRVYVDGNATTMVSKTGSRQVTRIVVIYSYDYDQARALYPKKKFGVGNIPKSNADIKEMEKTYTQETENDRNKVEIAHYFDIGGDKPIHLVFAGQMCSILETHKAKDYPFIDERENKPYIPIDNFKFQDSAEGFWNVGIGQTFYKYAITRQQLLNKAIAQSMNSMNDTQVINVASKKHGAILARIREAREMANNGKMGIIINDTGDEIKVSKLQADQYEQSIRLLNEWLDQEIKRYGYNLDAIREQVSTTATQILSESEVEDEKRSGIMDRNTEFFKRLHYRTIDFIRKYVDPNDQTPIWTTLRIDKKENGKKVLAPNGQPVKETVITTMGEIKLLLDKYNDGLYIEIDTKTGVKEKDSIKTAKALLAMRTTQNPAAINQAYKMLLEANNIQIDTDALEQPQEESQGASPSALQQVSKEMMP